MNQNIKTRRIYIIGAALLALFLGSMDALVMSAAMPTIVTELGGLHLYAWVYSAYFLARAVALPLFGKLCDLLNTKKLFLFSIGLFVLSSVAAGFYLAEKWAIDPILDLRFFKIKRFAYGNLATFSPGS